MQHLKATEWRENNSRILNSLYAWSKVKNENDAIQDRISDFDKRRISQPKNQ